MTNKSKHKYQNRIFSLLPEPGVHVNFSLKPILGTTNAAIWLSQILYWYDKGEMVNCIRKSRADLEKEIGLTRDQQIRVEEKLKQLGIVSIEVLPGRPSPINHITLHLGVLEERIHNVLKTRKLETVSKPVNTANTRPLTTSLRTDQSTQNTEDISETIQENTQKLPPPPSLSPGYVDWQEMGDKLKRKEDISEYK